MSEQVDNFVRKFRTPILIVLTICTATSALIFYSDTRAIESEVRLLSEEELRSVKGIQDEGLVEDEIVVDIEGQVASPGVIELKQGVSLFDAVETAGGFSSEADLYYIHRQLNLSSRVEDRQKIYIPSKIEIESCSACFDFYPEGKAPSGESMASVIGTININTASAAEIESLPGIGPSTASKIIDSRPYKTIEDLKTVSGIGEATYKKLEEYITI